jgi:hypothetical protein
MTTTLALFFLAITIPPAVKTLAVIAAVYGVLQGLKKIPVLTQYLTGWWAIGFNVVFSILGQLVVIPANQLYTANTLNIILTVLTTVLSAAGIHGTIKSMSAPQMLASFPPDPQVKEVPATLVPDDPAAVPVDPKADKKG